MHGDISIITVWRYSLNLRCEVLFRLTYRLGAGPGSGTLRWFLLRAEELASSSVAA
jgi:hypothetical protein